MLHFIITFIFIICVFSKISEIDKKITNYILKKIDEHIITEEDMNKKLKIINKENIKLRQTNENLKHVLFLKTTEIQYLEDTLKNLKTFVFELKKELYDLKNKS